MMGEPEPVAPDRDPIEPDEQAIALRALSFSALPNAGTDAENWERARLELREERQMTADRAAQIAQTRGSGDAVSDWLLAERELDISFRRRRDYRTKLAYWEGDQRAKATERERITRRAQQIGQSTSAVSDTDNWLRAERQIQAEHRLIAERARHAWAGTPRWLRAEQELTVEGVIPLPDDI
jgi:hypothetical protein